MDDTQKERLRNYAWDYFAFHAEQRMKTFHFYLIIETALITGFVLALTKINIVDSLVPSSLGLSLWVISLLFWRLDNRNKQLVRNGEEALKYLDELENLNNNDESDLERPHILNIFARDDWMLDREFKTIEEEKNNKTEQKQKRKFIFNTYSNIFNTIYLYFGIFGILAIAYSFYLNSLDLKTQNESMINDSLKIPSALQTSLNNDKSKIDLSKEIFPKT